MNFLSHFYFDRHYTDPQFILGSILPDLLKNANKNWNLHPDKLAESFNEDDRLIKILEGWSRHIQVDRIFHSSEFFMQHTREIKIEIAPLLVNSPVRPSFLAHVSLELLLDNLLVSNRIIDADDLYSYLRKIYRPALQKFLEFNGIADTPLFFNFFDRFIRSAYLKSYNEMDHLMYALTRICMRLWDDPINDSQRRELSGVFQKYREKLSGSFMDIFDKINTELS